MRHELGALAPHLDDVFEAFYRRLLSDPHFAGFFRGDEHVRELILRQRESIRQAVYEEIPQLRDRYLALGRLHHRIFVPFADFAVGMDFLANEVFNIIARDATLAPLCNTVFRFFKCVKDFTAKGYLEGKLEEDKRDLDMFISATRLSRESASGLIEQQLSWLRRVLEAIQREDEQWMPNLDPESTAFVRWLMAEEAANYLPPQERTHLLALNRRIHTDAANLFYFVKHQHYMEVLMMYDKLSKYVLSLNNIVTVLAVRFKMEELVRDPLTGLYSRNTLDETLTQSLGLAQFGGRPFSLVIIDLDDFKEINDTHGHLSGDCVLRHVAEIVQRYIRSSDYAFRYGGEEFLLVLNDTDIDGARLLAEKVRKTVEESRFPCDTITLRTTASFGVSEARPGEDLNATILIERADQHLYKATGGGKNRVVG